MKSIITEELRFRKRVCDFALKVKNMAAAARRYHTSRQQVSLWLKRYDGTVEIDNGSEFANSGENSRLSLFEKTFCN